MNRSNHLIVEARLKALETEITQIKVLLNQILNRNPINFSNAEEIVDTSNAVRLTGLPRHILYTKTSTGEIPGFRIGKGFKYKRSDLLQWMETQKHKGDLDIDEYVSKYIQTHILKG